MNPVAIVGAGIAGLTAAFRLRQNGVPVVVYESSDRAGGVIQTHHENGFLAEHGPNTILETSLLIGTLVHELGLDDHRVYSNPAAKKRFVVRNGQPVPLPTSPRTFFTTSLFSAGAKLRILREPFISPAPAGVEEDLATFVRRRLGGEFLDYAINPFVAGVYAGDPARLSVRHAFPKLHALEQEYGSLIRGQIKGAKERRRSGETSKQNAKMLSFDGGLQTIVDSLVSRLGTDLRLRTPVTAIQRVNESWMVVAANRTRRHSGVVLAAPAHKLPGIEFAQSFARFGQIHYPPVASVVLGFRRAQIRHALDGFGVLVPEVEARKHGIGILGALFSSSLFENRAPSGCATLTSYAGGVRNPALALMEPAELIPRVMKDLDRLLGIEGAPIFVHHARFREAIAQYDVGYGGFKSRMTELETESPGLFFAGHYRDGISVGDSIVSAYHIAARVQAFVAARQPKAQAV